MHLREELSAHGFAGGAVCFKTLVRFLSDEEFDFVHEMTGASNVSKLIGASDLEVVDYFVLQNVANAETVIHKSQLRKRSLPQRVLTHSCRQEV